MKHTTEMDWNRFLVKASGVTMLTVALTWLPQAVGAAVKIVTMIFVSRTISHPGEKIDELVDTYNGQMTSHAVGELLAFLILIGIARWILGYPRILRNWLELPVQEKPEPHFAEESAPMAGDQPPK